MTNAKHAMRLALAVVAVLSLVACAQTASDPAAEHGDDAASKPSSSAGLPDGRSAAGEARAQVKGKATGQSCIDCHGAEGNAPIDATYPKLGGQYADYLAHSLQEYRAGNRQHALMTPQAADLSDQDIADLAAYFASRPSQLRDLHGLK